MSRLGGMPRPAAYRPSRAGPADPRPRHHTLPVGPSTRPGEAGAAPPEIRASNRRSRTPRAATAVGERPHCPPIGTSREGPRLAPGARVASRRAGHRASRASLHRLPAAATRPIRRRGRAESERPPETRGRVEACRLRNSFAGRPRHRARRRSARGRGVPRLRFRGPGSGTNHPARRRCPRVRGRRPGPCHRTRPAGWVRPYVRSPAGPRATALPIFGSVSAPTRHRRPADARRIAARLRHRARAQSGRTRSPGRTTPEVHDSRDGPVPRKPTEAQPPGHPPSDGSHGRIGRARSTAPVHRALPSARARSRPGPARRSVPRRPDRADAPDFARRRCYDPRRSAALRHGTLPARARPTRGSVDRASRR